MSTINPRPRVRRQTSIDAYHAALARLPHSQAVVLGSVRSAGLHGRTCDEVAQDTGLDLLNVRPTMTALTKINMVTDSGQRRLTTRGKSAIVWVAPRDLRPA